MKNHTDLLIAKYLSGNASEKEKDTLTRWIEASEENRKIFERSELAWRRTRVVRHLPEADVDMAWQDLQQRIKTVPERKKIKIADQVRMAASISLFVCMALLVKWMVDGSRSPVRFANTVPRQTVTVPREELEVAEHTEIPDSMDVIVPSPAGPKRPRRIQEVAEQVVMVAVLSEDSAMVFRLPDKTMVYLNRNSKLTYAENFGIGSERSVYLSGEAYFETSGGDVPFFVFCRNTRSMAMGASFNVMGYESRSIEVSVIEGVVEVKRTAPSESMIVLGKDEKVVYNNETEQFIQSRVTKKEKWWKRVSFRQIVKDFFNRIIHRNP